MTLIGIIYFKLLIGLLIEVAKEHDYIKEADMEKLKAWKKDPNDESWMEK